MSLLVLFNPPPAPAGTGVAPAAAGFRLDQRLVDQARPQVLAPLVLRLGPRKPPS